MSYTIQRYEIRPKTERGKIKKCIYVPGVDYGAPLVIIEESEKRILCSRGGHMTWAGIGTSRYANPEFFVFEKDENGDLADSWGLGTGFEYDKKTRKEVFQKALEYFRR